MITGIPYSSLRRIAYAVGIGLALFPIHWAGQPLLQYVFLPQIGLAFTLAALVMYFSLANQYRHKITLGSKFIWIPMLVIVASMVLQVIVRFNKESAATAMFGVCLFGVYIVARDIALAGMQKLLKAPLIIMLSLVTIGGIAVGIASPGKANGGLITNYCAAVGFLVLAGMLVSRKWLWIAAGPLLVSVFLIGALEGVFVLASLGVIVLLRRDWGRRMLPPIGLLLTVVLAWTASGNLGITYNNAIRNITALLSLESGQAEEDYGSVNRAVDASLSGCWSVLEGSLHHVKPLGNGYILTANIDVDQKQPVHNVPLMISDQIGPLAGMAWLWVSIYCLIKTKWKYLWSAVLIVSILDYYVWTQFAPLWWCLVGLSTTGDIKSDLIFRTVGTKQ